MPKTILLVEEEKTVIDTLSEFLRGQGYLVEAAHNGEEALRNLPVVRPDLILLDIVLPEINGIDLLKQMQKSGSEFADVPVLILTNLQGDEQNFQKMGLKIAGYFVKANTPLQELNKKVKEILEK